MHSPAVMEYAYQSFKRELLRQDVAFSGGPAPGERFPEFDLPTAEGGRLELSDYAGSRLFVTLASFT